MERCRVVRCLNRLGFELAPFVVLRHQVIGEFLCQFFRCGYCWRTDDSDLNVISDYRIDVRRRFDIAYLAQVEFCESAENIRIISAIPDALEFGHPCRADHIGRLSVRLRLTTDVAVVVGIVGKVIWSFLHWDVAGSAASVFDVERTGYVLRVRSNWVSHRAIDLC